MLKGGVSLCLKFVSQNLRDASEERDAFWLGPTSLGIQVVLFHFRFSRLALEAPHEPRL
jgi:hypothetical protein